MGSGEGDSAPEGEAGIARIFDEWAGSGRGEGMEAGHWPTARQALDDLPVRPGERCLDLGCGNGYAARYLATRCAPGVAVGVDLSERMLGLALARSKEAPNALFVRAAFDLLPFPGASFHHAFSMEALYYAPDLERALAELHRVMAPGGQVACVVDFFYENRYCHRWPEKVGLPMHLLREAEWVERFQGAGFQAVRADRLTDPRDVPADWAFPRGDFPTREDLLRWRREIGSLRIRAERPKGA